MGLCTGGTVPPISYAWAALEGDAFGGYGGGLGIAQAGYAHRLNPSTSDPEYCKFWWFHSGDLDTSIVHFYKCIQTPGDDQVFMINWFYKSDDEVHFMTCSDNTYTNCNDVAHTPWYLDFTWYDEWVVNASEAGQWQSDVMGTDDVSSNHGKFDPMNERTTNGWSGHGMTGPFVDCSTFYHGFYDANSNNARMTTWTDPPGGSRSC